MNIKSLLSPFIIHSIVFSLLTAVVHASGENESPSPGTSLTPPSPYIEAAPKHGFETPVAAANTDAQLAVLRGLSHLITFWDEAAYLEFKNALFHDPDCAMAHWGLVISTITPHDEKTKEKEQSLKKLESILANETAPERELEYIRALYLLLREGPREAANSFIRISQKWRNDEIAPLFAAMLIRDGFSENGNRNTGQQKAIDILDPFIEKHPDLQPALFLRILIEETAPVISAEILAKTQKMLELSPDNPPANHLTGHLLFRTGQYQKAEEHFSKAAVFYQKWQEGSGLTLADNEGYFRAIMYKSVSEFCRGNFKEAQETSQKLNKLPINTDRLKAKGTAIQLWEVRNLPLTLALSTNMAVDKKALETSFPPALHTKNALLSNSRTAINLQYASMLLAHQDKNKEAVAVHAENMAQLSANLIASEEHARQECSLTYWVRTLNLCDLFQIESKAILYPDSSETWYAEASGKQKTASMLLPPVLPYPVEWKLALWYLNKGQYEKCIKACDAALAKFPNHIPVKTTRQEAESKLPKLLPEKDPQTNNNPFLKKEFLISWSKLTPDKLKSAIETAIALSKKNIDAICTLDPGNPANLTYENTFQALEDATKPLSTVWIKALTLKSLMDTPALREAMTEVTPDVVKFNSSIALDPGLWKIIKAASECPWVKELSPVKQRFIQETLISFKDRGANLPEEKKDLFSEIETELTMLTKWFGENVLDSTNNWEHIITNPDELKGLPDSAKEHARLDALNKGHGTEETPAWRFTIPPVSSTVVLKFAESDNLRRKVWEGLNQIGTGEKNNEPLIASILKLRKQKANLLDYPTFADYTTANRMAKTGQTALDFINDLHSKVKPFFDQETKELLAFKNKTTNGNDKELDPWEIEYWKEKRRQAEFNFDEEDLRPYQEVNRVMEGMIKIFSNLYSINIKKRPTVYLKNGRKRTKAEAQAIEVWHPEVNFYEIHDRNTKEHLGSFYTDWHPRESKRSGAWMSRLIPGCPPMKDKPREPHLALMAGNMTKGLQGKPSLLIHREVVTIFHEFGHLLHQILSDVEVKSLCGTNVPWDFVELPSQINENWCWQKESVDTFAKHHKTGKKIPDELFDKMVKARNYMSASSFMRQLSLGKLDLELHHHYDKYKNMKLEAADETILKDYRVPTTQKSLSYARRLSHIFSSPTGYAAGYYSYKWAEVLEADAFSRFLDKGISNPETGKDFRDAILSKGNSKPADELYRDFMGRNPDSNALLIKFDLVPAKAEASTID